MWKAIVLAVLLSCGLLAQEAAAATAKVSPREAALAKAIEKHEMHHFEMHRFFIPLTQGNLQWMTSRVGAAPDEAITIWKLMQQWDDMRALRMRQRENPS